jgi:cell division transport system permease protein
VSWGYSLKEALADFWQDKITTLLAIVTIAFSLLVLNFFLLLIWNLDQIVKDFKKQFQIQIYLVATAQPGEIADLEAFLRSQPEVENLKFVSQEEALEEMKEFFGADLLKGLDENPLPRSFVLDIRERFRVPRALAGLANRIRARPGVEEVEYGKESLDRLDSLFNTAVKVVLLFGGFILVAIVLIVANTIRLLINLKRETVRLYRLMGARSGLVVLPFVWESLILGFFGTFLSLVLLWGIFRLFQIRLFSLVFLPYQVIFIMLGTVLLLSLLGGLISLRRVARA